MRRTSGSFADARFASDARFRRARRAFSVDPGETFDRCCADAFSRRNPRFRARLRRASAHLTSRFTNQHQRLTTPRLPPRHTHPRFPTLRSGRRDAVRCAGAARAKTGSGGGSSFTGKRESFKIGHRSRDRCPIDTKPDSGRSKISPNDGKSCNIGARHTEVPPCLWAG